MNDSITFTVLDVFDIPQRGGLLVRGRLAGGNLSPGDVLLEPESGRSIQIMGFELMWSPAKPDVFTVMVDRSEREIVRPGMEFRSNRTATPARRQETTLPGSRTHSGASTAAPARDPQP
jgi:hypothetical protein